MSLKSGENKPLRRLSYSVFEVYFEGKKCHGAFVSDLAICYNIDLHLDSKPHIKYKVKGRYHIQQCSVLMVDVVCKIAILDFHHDNAISLTQSRINVSPGDQVIIFDNNKYSVWILSNVLTETHDAILHQISESSNLGSVMVSEFGDFLGICVEPCFFLPEFSLRKVLSHYKSHKNNLVYSDLGFGKPRSVTFEDAIKFKLSTISGFIVRVDEVDLILLSISDNDKDYELGEGVGMQSIFYFDQRLEPGRKIILTIYDGNERTKKIIAVKEKMRL
jgi:hypothetical protein